MRQPGFLTPRGAIAFTHDLAMAAISLPLSLWLRLGSDEMSYAGNFDAITEVTGLFTAVAGAVYLTQGLYRGIWRYASVNDLVALVRAVTLVIIAFVPLLFLITRLSDFPRSVLVINWFVLLTLLGGPRFLYRLTKDRLALRAESAEGRRVPVLLAGDGDGAELFIRAMRGAGAGYRPVGILSSQASAVGRHMHGVEVLGMLGDIDTVVAGLRRKGQAPERLVLTEEQVDGAAVRRLLDACDAVGMTLARLPGLNELRSGVADKVEVAPVAVEDLLGRPQTVLDRAAMRALLRGQRVLVTGAGGSIGGELARQIAEAGPAALMLFDNNEYALYTIDQEIAASHPMLARRAAIGDVRDRGRVAQALAEFRPELVFHAAALKHVPLVEAHPVEGALTNAVGTRIVADACRAAGVTLMVLISTDKAVNPSSVMGAAKRAAETYCQALDADGAHARNGTRFVTVRFGNVLGSTGSVVPLFRSQLAAGGPLTVTHPDVTRYFMTVREAVELVLQASALGLADESWRGRVFVLDMGEPVRIVDLARQMIRLAGKRPDIDVKIAFTGLRPGEKLFEEIFHSAEPPVPTGRTGILAAPARRFETAEVARALDTLEDRCRALDAAGVLESLHRLVPEYAPAPASIAAD